MFGKPKNHESNRAKESDNINSDEPFGKMAAEMPDYEQHMAELQQNQTESSSVIAEQAQAPEYKTLTDLKEHFAEALANKGLSENLTKHPAFDRIITKTGFFNEARNNNMSDLQPDKSEEGYSFNFHYEKNYMGKNLREVTNSVEVISPTEFQISMRNEKPSFDGKDGARCFEVDETRSNFSINDDGTILEKTASGSVFGVSERAKQEYNVSSVEDTTYREYAADGREIRSEYQRYRTQELENVDSSLRQALFKHPISRKDRYNDDYDTITRLKRADDNRVDVFIEQKSPDGATKTYAATEDLNSEHGTDDLVLQNGHRDLK